MWDAFYEAVASTNLAAQGGGVGHPRPTDGIVLTTVVTTDGRRHIDREPIVWYVKTLLWAQQLVRFVRSVYSETLAAGRSSDRFVET